MTVGMIARHRRWFAPLAAALVAAPLVVGLVAPDGPASVLKEGRRLAPAPAWPATAAGWRALPAAVDAWLKDHFGLRSALIQAHKELTRPLLASGSEKVLVGRDGRMFYLGEDAVRQSAGLVLRDGAVAASVDLVAEIDAALAKRGVRLIVASPPNGSTVYQDALPDWAQRHRRPTEYDLFMQGLAEKGVRAVDLRPVMAKARDGGAAYFRHDTHWTAEGALAAFNAVVAADGHPDWRLDPATALGPPTVKTGGDLARLLGVQDGVTESVRELTLKDAPKTLLTANWWEDFVESSGRPGPTILILGDSFTGAHFAPMLLEHAGRVVWLEHQHCGFDWGAIDRFRPDEVWWMPTERFLVCGPGARPVGFPG